MDLYLADREEMKTLLRDLTTELREMRSEMDRDNGRGVAEAAGVATAREMKATHAERWWDVGKTLGTAVLGVAGTLIAIWLGGSPG